MKDLLKEEWEKHKASKNMNIEAVEKFYDLLDHQKQTEIRALALDKNFKPLPKEAEVIFTFSKEDFVNKVKGLNGKKNLYAGLNERKENCKEGKDVLSVKKFFVDIDCKNKPASEEDLIEASSVTNNIVSDIKRKFGAIPSVIMSGNGYQLVYSIPEIKIDDKNREEIENKIQEYNEYLIQKYSNEKIKLDKVGDLPRIIRITGTQNIKGGKISKFVEYNTEENINFKDNILSMQQSEKVIQKTNNKKLSEELKKKFIEILEQDEKVKKLYEGNFEGYDLSIGGEQALVCFLIQYNFDKKEIFNIMASAQIGRWNEKNIKYREDTYKKALASINYQKKKEKKDIKKKEEELKNKLLEEHKQRISGDEGITSLLKNPNLFTIIDIELQKKITGEEKSRKSVFLSMCSIWNKDNSIPLNTLVSSESSVGKSYICKKVVDIFPKNLVVWRTKISGEAFTYWHVNEKDFTWDGKILYLEDIGQSVLDSDTFKVMCSEGSVASVVKNQETIDLVIKGKPCMLITTARTNPTTEVLNRFNIIGLDESAKQTHDVTLNQAMECKNEEYDENITNALMLLERKNVKVPFGKLIHNYITKNYTWNDVRMRRDFSRLRDLIKCSAVLHQFQREKDESGILIATKEDYEISRECINYIKTTTLKGLTHKLKKSYEMCVKEEDFTAKDIHAKNPIVSQAMWYRYLDELCERGLLKTELRDSAESKKRVTYFTIPKHSSFNLPSFEELSIIDIKRISDTNDIIDIKETDNNSIKCINSTTLLPPKTEKRIETEDLGFEDQKLMEGDVRIEDPLKVFNEVTNKIDIIGSKSK